MNFFLAPEHLNSQENEPHLISGKMTWQKKPVSYDNNFFFQHRSTNVHNMETWQKGTPFRRTPPSGCFCLTSGGQRLRGNEDITFSIYHVTPSDHVINTLCQLVYNCPLSEASDLSSLVAIGLAEVEI